MSFCTDLILCRQSIIHSTLPAAKDEWDFEFLGMSNHPFIKANYPHHEGIWGWEDAADQVVMMVRNIRRSMVECEFCVHILVHVFSMTYVMIGLNLCEPTFFA